MKARPVSALSHQAVFHTTLDAGLRAVFGSVRLSCRTVNGEHIGCSPRPERFGEDVGKCVKTLISLGFTAKHVSRSLAKNAAATGYAQYSTHPRGGELVASNRKPL
jgi:hypothetical protein